MARPKKPIEQPDYSMQTESNFMAMDQMANELNRRQSAPKPTVMDELSKMQSQQMMQNQGVAQNGAIDGFRALSNPIGKEAIQKATQTLQKYKEGKSNLEKRIIDNEQWYKLRHWESLRKTPNEVQPTSGWLFNCIANKHADAMDNFPSPTYFLEKRVIRLKQRC